MLRIQAQHFDSSDPDPSYKLQNLQSTRYLTFFLKRFKVLKNNFGLLCKTLYKTSSLAKIFNDFFFFLMTIFCSKQKLKVGRIAAIGTEAIILFCPPATTFLFFCITIYPSLRVGLSLQNNSTLHGEIRIRNTVKLIHCMQSS